jgi:hypothetical protein
VYTLVAGVFFGLSIAMAHREWSVFGLQDLRPFAVLVCGKMND